MMTLKFILNSPVTLLLVALIAAIAMGYLVQRKGAGAPAQQTGAPSARYRRISAEEARDMMDGAEAFILLDVRTAQEYRDGHIGGAVLIPDVELSARAETELPDRDALIFVYCRSGRRSAGAARALVSMGYTNVYDFGGIMDWPYETE